MIWLSVDVCEQISNIPMEVTYCFVQNRRLVRSSL
jgi:hypothetical protein